MRIPILDRLFNRPTPVAPTEQNIVERIWANPADFNRQLRRSAGYRKPVSLVSPQFISDLDLGTKDPLMPRYVKRHADMLMGSRAFKKTRRARKARARIIRAVAPLGFGPKDLS